MGLKAIKLFFKAVLVVFSFIILSISVIGLLASNVNPNDHFNIQFFSLALPVILFLAFFLLIFWLINKSWLSIVPLLAIIINYQFITLMFQTNLFSVKETTNSNPRVIAATYNVHYFSHLKDDVTVNYIANYMSANKVNILCMQEFSSHILFNINEITGTFDFLPYSTLNSDKAIDIGLVIFSSFPIKRSGRININSGTNGAQWADIELSDGKTVRVINVHLQTTGVSRNYYLGIRKNMDIIGENFKRRAIQANIIQAVIDSTKTPVILCGDFNDIPSSYVYKRAKGNLIDGFREAGSGFGSTFMHKANLLRIDYIMYSNFFEGVRYYSEYKNWSDHNPVIAELEYRKK